MILDWCLKSILLKANQIVVNDNNANNRQLSKVLIMNAEGEAFLTEYAVLSNNNDVGVFEANVNSGTIRLYFTPVSSNTSVYFRKEVILK